MTTEYKQSLCHALHRDLKAANNFLKVCRHYILEAAEKNDDDTMCFWANQQDTTSEQIEMLNWQMKHVS